MIDSTALVGCLYVSECSWQVPVCSACSMADVCMTALLYVGVPVWQCLFCGSCVTDIAALWWGVYVFCVRSVYDSCSVMWCLCGNSCSVAGVCMTELLCGGVSMYQCVFCGRYVIDITALWWGVCVSVRVLWQVCV